METGVGKRIKKRRIELNLTQEELAHRMGYKSKAAICKVEGGEDNITSDRIHKFADALNCSPAYLMGWSEIPEVKEIPHLHDWSIVKTETGMFPKGSIIVSTEKQAAISEEDKEAKRLYDLYLQASPEIQAAVETLLKSQLRDS